MQSEMPREMQRKMHRKMRRGKMTMRPILLGFAAAALITDWALIVGKDVAGYTAPERLKWPRGVGMRDQGVGRDVFADGTGHGVRHLHGGGSLRVGLLGLLACCGQQQRRGQQKK